MESPELLTPASEAAILSRICLMIGSHYDDESILSRLEIDCGLTWTWVDLGIAKCRLGFTDDRWAAAFNHLVTLHGATPSLLKDFHALQLETPGEAGFWLGRQMPHLKLEDAFGLWPQNSRPINAGLRLSRQLPPGLSRPKATRILSKCRDTFRLSEIQMGRLLELIHPDPIPSPLAQRLAAVQVQALTGRRRLRRKTA